MNAPTLKCRREARIYRTNWSPFCEKIFNFVRDIAFLNSDGASSSILIKAKFLMNMVCYDKVAFKITCNQIMADSAYETEMKMYDLVSNFAFSGDIPFVMQYYHAEVCDTAQFISILPSADIQKEFLRQYVVIYTGITAFIVPDHLRNIFSELQTDAGQVRRFVDELSMLPGATSEQDKTKLRIIMMERSEGSPLTKMSHEYSLDMLVGLLAQILWTLSRFQRLGIMHHDLHTGNVFVEKMGSPVTWKLCYGPSQADFVMIDTKYMAKIFDWDHSCIVPHEKNTSVKVENMDLDRKSFCPLHGECNTFLKGRDAAQVLYHLRNDLRNCSDFDGRDRLITFLSKYLKSMDSIVQTWFGQPCVCPENRKVSGPGPVHMVSPTGCNNDTSYPCTDVENLESPAEILRAMREEFNLRDTNSSTQIRICSFEIDEAIGSSFIPVDFEVNESILLMSEEKAKQLHEVQRRAFSRDVDALCGVATY